MKHTQTLFFALGVALFFACMPVAGFPLAAFLENQRHQIMAIIVQFMGLWGELSGGVLLNAVLINWAIYGWEK